MPSSDSPMPRLQGTVHCHSQHSFDAQLSYAELKAFFSARGLSFVCITEHIEYLNQDNVDAILADCEANSDEQFLFIPGIEMDYFKIYFLGVSPTNVDFSDHRSIFDSLYPNAELCIFSHPIKARYQYPQWLIERCDGVEILNTKHDGRHYFRPQSERLLHQVRKQRPAAVGVAGMDFHSPKQYSATHLVLSQGIPLTRASVIDAIRQGQFEIQMQGKTLTDYSQIKRNLLRAKIHAMDLAHKINKGLADSGIQVPRPLKRLFRKSMEGA
ncbi:MAG: PHP domain-containing protein [Lamprobacter sp.]|uniref:PHP domain-containing protein n=1 Tax=Lamprobacter sp. TaxID=3100796 RepID=UPI002B262F26|nr:PHP domain-containing protein [Lamprobacter sp.]MEA3639810.1 PHP domain-containing protein [Lamprobacter sp.]